MVPLGRLRTALAAQTTVAAVVAGAMLLLGAAVYPSLPERMAIHWNAAGRPDRTVARPVAVLAMPAVVVGMRVLFAVTGEDAAESDRVVGSLAMVVLLAVHVMALASNLGVDVPIVPVSLALCLGLVAVAVWLERG